jgi:hypothetical protein
MKKLVLLLALALLLISASAVYAATYEYFWDGKSGTDSEKCFTPKPDDPRYPFYASGDGWIHWVFTDKPANTTAKLYLGGTGSGEYDQGPPLTANIFHFYTPYFELNGLTAKIVLDGSPAGDNVQFNISDYCPGEKFEKLDVTKTVVTSFTRTHKWDIAKKVETEKGFTKDGFPKIWLYTDGSGNEKATWTIDVKYKGYDDSDFNVSGKITIKNTGDLDAVITAVDDVLGGTAIDVDCGVTFPYSLTVGETLTCDYDEDGYFEGVNMVTVTTERAVYGPISEPIIWGDPTTELYETVKVKDISALFGEVDLGTVTAPEGDTFTYDKNFAWADYGAEKCGGYTYPNTASIVETKQSASATLKVNVQCFIFQGETAWAANGTKPLELRYTKQGNWATYVEYKNVEKTTTLFAGQTIPVGTVGFSTVSDGKVTITVTLTAPWKFEDVAENLKVQDYAKAPSGNPEPGLFAHKKTCDTAWNACSIVVPANKFYGVHVNVGQWVPDPKFGP